MKNVIHEIANRASKIGYRRALLLLCVAMPLLAQSPDYPVFVAQVPNPNDYSLFSNSGGDGNWYVGYTHAWITQLPAIPKGTYTRAFIGAKVGRAKVLPPVGRPPQFDPIPGELWMAIASTPTWPAGTQFQLTSTEDIPVEGAPEYTLDNTGESEWYWAETPLSAVNVAGDNYVALWSPSPTLVSVSSSPILAAAWGGRDVKTWLISDLKGELPQDPRVSLKSGVSVLQPAIALKLLVAHDPHPMRVRVVSWKNGTPDHLNPVLTGSVDGDSVERVWIEYHQSNRVGDVVRDRWVQVGRSLWKAPYIFTLDQQKLPHGKLFLRIAAVNIWEEKGTSEPFGIEVSPLNEKTK